MKKLVLVETIGIFKHQYAVLINEDEDNVVAADYVKSNPVNEMSQRFLDELVLGTRTINETEYLKMFDEANQYLLTWSDEDKKQFIYDKEKKYDDYP